jgi:cytochrome c peroxidase
MTDGGRGVLAALLLLTAAAAWAEVPADRRNGDTPLLYRVIAPQRAFEQQPQRAALGRRIFFDANLSEPAGLACAGCHDPQQAFSGDRGSRLDVAPGSRPGRFGVRNTPSLLYARYSPPLYLFMDDDATVPEPRGGLFADGRVDTLADLPIVPLTNPQEMGNRDVAMVARKLARADYADELRRQFGADVFADRRRTIAALGEALQAYLQSDAMAPFNSRYDAFIRGQGKLSEQELRGVALFRNPDKGNCASCHGFNPTSNDPARSLFTDYAYESVAVPRNAKIPANADPQHYDLGLCETARARHWNEPAQWCGYFRTPSLRNVAVRRHYMHNGEFDDLRQVVRYYATRGTDPWTWYPRGRKFDDVPLQYQRNLNINSTPYNRIEGMRPTLDDVEIDAIVAFLKTLTDSDYEVRLEPAALR